MHRLLAGSGALLVSLSVYPVWAQNCVSDADCGVGYECDFGDVAIGTAPCVDPENCPPPEPVEPSGTCALGPIPCAIDADCPSPLLCGAYEDSPPCGSTDPSMPCEPVVEVTKQCAFVPAECSTNADCAAGYECVTAPGGQSCESTGVACPVGEVCPVPEPVCETGPGMVMCFPARVPCAADADCSGDWSCLDVVAATGEMLPWWEGVTDPRACMPPGLVVVFEGRADVDESDSDSSAAPERAGSGSAEEGNAAAAAPSSSAEPSGDEGGCAIASGSTSRTGWVVALLLAGLGLRRRRLR